MSEKKEYKKCPLCFRPDPELITLTELRNYLEGKLKRLSILRSMDFQYFEKFSEDLLSKFCKPDE